MSIWDKYECEGQLSLFDIIPAKVNTECDVPVINECEFSKHTCNKEELWKVAEPFDDIECPKICCRQCKVKCCGARCNGSEEPKEEATLNEPPFDKSLLNGIKGIDEIIHVLPKYKIVLKEPDFKGRKNKTAVWVGYWHSISDSGWNYKMQDIESYAELVTENVEVDIRGYCDDGYCPICNLWLDDLTEQCPQCGTSISWDRWRKMNGK